VKIKPDLNLEELAAGCLKRPFGGLFTLPEKQLSEFIDICRDSVTLITGAAGFIAQATLPHILAAEPRRLYLLDSSENGLADLARKLATSRRPGHVTDIRMILSDISSPLLNRAIHGMGDVDLVLHFAAVKHVRSERDPASALRILDVNLAGTDRLLCALADKAVPPRVFAVSTDKAAEPTSIMGASKLLMESLLWAYPGNSTSARFANVLFSSGSITESWVDRIGRSEPLSAPIETYRYFVSPREAGLICANALVAPNRSIVVPSAGTLEPVDLVALASRFLESFGKIAVEVSLDDWRRDPGKALPSNYLNDQYPLVCTLRDPAGEKEVEEFARHDEAVVPWTKDLSLICENEPLETMTLIPQLDLWNGHPTVAVSVDQIRAAISCSISEFRGVASEMTLDARI
jgi:FlaA1/EpsC-like NDP-sugar epimerase